MMAVFLPLSTNYHLHYEENEINNLVKDQVELKFTEYDHRVVRLCKFSYIIVLGFSVFILWLKY
jgi:hypothetical protein